MLNTLFSTMKIGNCTIPNRLVVPAMVTNFCTEDGMVTDRLSSILKRRLKEVGG
ncbi:MAG: hypothetical protein ACLTCI_07380 [[Clostridium] nexile]